MLFYLIFLRFLMTVFIFVASDDGALWFVPGGGELQEVMPGFVKGKLMEEEDFSGSLDNWMREGKVNAEVRNGCLFFESLDSIVENPKGNIWWRVDLHEPYAVEFDYKSLSTHGLTMIFWNATELDGSDVFHTKRTGKYEEYINGLNAYHVSFHRFGSGVSNIRKAPGFHLVATIPDPIAPADTLWHKVMIASAGNRQRVFMDGKLVHDFIDEGSPCFNDKKWQHPTPCSDTGPVHTHGAIGIRHTQKQKALYDNFRVFRLERE